VPSPRWTSPPPCNPPTPCRAPTTPSCSIVATDSCPPSYTHLIARYRQLVHELSASLWTACVSARRLG
jgi:hypothetical protein